MDRVVYEVDPFNRLIVKGAGRPSRVKRFRQVVYGRFVSDRKNNLSYEVNKSAGIDIPQKIGFSGRYSLDKDHNLVFTLDKWNNQCEGNRLTLKTKIIDAKSNEITFLINSRIDENKSLVYIMRLYGAWQADRHNRLSFGVERDRRGLDRLVLFGAWEIDRNNEISYRYGEDSQVIGFKGHWDITDRYRISYLFDKKLKSGFNFKASIGKLRPEGLSFDIGIGVSKTKKVYRRVIFSGKWKIGKDKEIILETSDIEKGGLTLRFTKEMFDKKGLAYIESIVRPK